MIGGKDILKALRGQLAAPALGLVPGPVWKDSLLKFFPERNVSSGFTDRCSHHLIHLVLSVARAEFWALSRGRPTLRSDAAVIFFQDGAGVTQEAEKTGSAVSRSLFVVAFVAGVLPFRVKACCLKLQPVLTSAGLGRTKAASRMNYCSSLLTDYPEAQMLIDIWSGDVTWRTNKLGAKAAKIHWQSKTVRLWGLTGCNSVISYRDNLHHIKPFTL